jgi:hypothetical protein
VTAVLAILLSASGAIAQEGHWQEIGVQGTGFFTKDSNGNGINQHATDTGGFLAVSHPKEVANLIETATRAVSK